MSCKPIAFERVAFIATCNLVLNFIGIYGEINYMHRNELEYNFENILLGVLPLIKQDTKEICGNI